MNDFYFITVYEPHFIKHLIKLLRNNEIWMMADIKLDSPKPDQQLIFKMFFFLLSVFMKILEQAVK
jgi:GT2 family glycosyltransferase